MRIFNPPVFQGSLNRKSYFEGWYFKQVSENLDHVYAFIPGISLNKNDRHAFIQIINGISGETDYVTYPLDAFRFDKRKLWVQIDDSTFTDKYIELNIHSPKISIEGKLYFSSIAAYPFSFTAPGIMGWYSYIPFMECYHGVVSANHELKGQISINREFIDFTGGKGYIEKDWGRSFPECWIWLQSNNFEEKEQSLFVSVAKIPWLGRFFIGFIAFVYHRGKYIPFTTYNGSKLQKTELNGSDLEMQFSNKNYQLKIQVHVNKAGDLVAPVKGKMDRMIKESIDSEVSFDLQNKQDQSVIRGNSRRAGLEIIEGIFDYL